MELELPGDAGADVSLVGTWSVGGGDKIRSSLSELFRRIAGASARTAKPIALELFAIRLPPTASNPAATSLEFAFSLSERSRSLSAASAAA
jgi:hypothetical protein